MKKVLLTAGIFALALTATGCGEKDRYTNHIQRLAHTSQHHHMKANHGGYLNRDHHKHHAHGHVAHNYNHEYSNAKYIPGEEYIRGNYDTPAVRHDMARNNAANYGGETLGNYHSNTASVHRNNDKSDLLQAPQSYGYEARNIDYNPYLG